MKLTEQEAIQKLDTLITFFKEFGSMNWIAFGLISEPGLITGPAGMGYPSDF